MLKRISYSNAAGLYVFCILFTMYTGLAITMIKLDKINDRPYLGNETITLNVSHKKSLKNEEHADPPKISNQNCSAFRVKHNISFASDEMHEANYSLSIQKDEKEEKKEEELIEELGEGVYKRKGKRKRKGEFMEEHHEENVYLQTNKHSDEEEAHFSSHPDEELEISSKLTIIKTEKTIKELIKESHEIFKLIYGPNKNETRLAILTLLFAKLILSIFFIGVFYRRKLIASGTVAFSTISNEIKGYTWTDFWIAIYSTVIAMLAVYVVGYLLIYRKTDKDEFANKSKAVRIIFKFKRVTGYPFTWAVLMFAGWAIILFSIEFDDGTRSNWIIGAVIANIIGVCFTSVIIDVGLIYLKRGVVITYRKIKNK